MKAPSLLPLRVACVRATGKRRLRNGVHLFSLIAGVLIVLVPSDADAQCAPPPGNLVSWWRAQGDAHDSAGTNGGTLDGGLDYAAGQFGQAFNYTADGQIVTVPASASLNVGAGPGFTVEGWINPASATTQMPIAEWNSAGNPAAHLWISVSYAGFGGPGSIYASLHGGIPGIFSTGPGVIQAGVWQHIAMTWDQASGAARLYRNGIQVAATNLSGQVPVTSPNLYLGARPGGPTFRGGLDEVSLYSRALSASEIVAAYGAGKCVPKVPPSNGPGNALSLDGVGSYVDVPDGVWFNGDFTVEGWVNVRSYTDWSRLLDFGNYDGVSEGVDSVLVALSEGTTGRPHFHVLSGSTVGPGLVAPDPLPLNQWAHLACVLNGTAGTIYINGNPVSTGTLQQPRAVARVGCYIGRSNWPRDAYANAIFDEVRIWNVARSGSQIQEAMRRQLFGNEGGLVAYYRFDEQGGLSAFDSTGNPNNTATLVNGPAWVASTITMFAPPVTTMAASTVTETNALLNGRVDGRTSTDTFSVYFDWGTSPSFGNVTPTLFLGAGTPPQDWAFPVNGLINGTTYYFRAVAQNSAGASYGATLTFSAHPPAIALPATLPDLKLFTSGNVLAMAVQSDGKIIIGGNFQSVNEVPRLNLARLNPNGSVDLTWNPPSPNFEVYSLCVDGTNLFVGGAFNQIGASNRQGLAKFSLADSGSLDADWKPLLFQAGLFPVVNSLAISGGQLYVGGAFVQIGGLNRTNLVRVDPQGTGQVDASWAPNPNLDVLSILPSGQDLFVGGRFTRIGGLDRTNAAKLFTAGPGASDSTWDAKIIQTLPVSQSGVLSLAIDQTNLFIGGDFVLPGGIARTNLAKLDIFTGSPDSAWLPSDKARSVRSLAVTNDSLFAAGYFGNSSFDTLIKLSATATGVRDNGWRPEPFQSTNGSPKVNVILAANGAIYVGGAVSRFGNEVRLGLARLDAIAGSVDRQFNAQVQYQGFVRALACQADGKVIIGGDFYFVGGLPRRNLARVNQDGSLDTTWAPTTSGPVLALAWSSNNVFVGGDFTNVNGFSRRYLAKISTAGKDAVDELWNPSPNARVLGFAVSSTNLFVSGDFFLIGGQVRFRVAKLSTLETGAVDTQWNPGLFPKNGFSTPALALSGDDLFMGGFFDSVGGLGRTNLVKVSATGSGIVDPLWNPGLIGANPPPPGFAYEPEVSAMLAVGTNLFVAGFYTNVGGVPRAGLAKLSTLGTGLVDADWKPQLNTDLPGDLSVSALALDGTNLFAGGLVIDTAGSGQYSQPILKVSTEGTGNIDPDYHVYHAFLNALLATPMGVYLGGIFTSVSGDYQNFVPRNSFALMTIPDPPQLIQGSATNLLVVRNAGDGPEVTHFLITSVTGGTLYRSDGVTPVNAGDFLTVAEGEAGLRLAVGGTITAVSAVNDTVGGAGRASSTLTMSANSSPTFRFSSSNYRVREGQGNVVVIVRKYGSGAASVDYRTVEMSATAGADFGSLSGTLNFTAIETARNLIIPIYDDGPSEGDEQFGVTLTNASVGASIAGPATALVTLVDNDIVGVSDSVTSIVAPAAPPLASGGLVVTLQPPEAIGQWRLPGELNWHNSGAAIAGLVSGNYALEFRPIRGYRQPDITTVPISAGATSQLTFFYAAVTPLEIGSLSVNVQPVEVATAPVPAARGQWHLQGEGIWRDSDEAVPGLNVGSYTVEFKTVPGRLTPPPQIVEVGAGATYGTVGTYFVGAMASAVTPAVVPFNTATANAPYLYNGQVQTSVGFGSGFVVKQRVVLTAAHVLFDDVLLSYSTYARWFFQRYRDQLEPVPQVPRGWYVFEGYAAQRQLDNSPNISTPLSQNLDAAALYFLEDAGRGGYGGYLSSDADSNEYLLSANNKFLAGYPLDGVADGDKGKLFATAPANLSFTRLYSTIFATTNVQSFPGNSGGPLYVQADIDKYLPAGIVLGGSGQLLVRAINSEVVDLINRGEISANGGGNIVGGGVIILSPGITAPPFGTGLLTVRLSPSNSPSTRPGWRIAGDQAANFFTNSVSTVALIGGGGYPVEFKTIPGFITPSNRTIQMAVGGMVTVQADYVPIGAQLKWNAVSGLSFSGGTGARYRVEFATNLTPPAQWTPLTSFTLSGSSLLLTNTRPANAGQRFYRSVFLP